MCDDWEYLEDQHLLLAVKTADGLESYGSLWQFSSCWKLLNVVCWKGPEKMLVLVV